MRRIWKTGIGLGTAGLLLLAGPAVPGQAQEQQCVGSDHSTETVVASVTVTYTSAFRCADAAGAGEYAIIVTFVNHAESDQAVSIEDVALSHATPRPRGLGPEATATVDGLPTTVAPGAEAHVAVRGTYELVGTDEGRKATLHLRAQGLTEQADQPFALGINVQLRSSGATENGKSGGPPVDRGAAPDNLDSARGCR